MLEIPRRVVSVRARATSLSVASIPSTLRHFGANAIATKPGPHATSSTRESARTSETSTMLSRMRGSVTTFIVE